MPDLEYWLGRKYANLDKQAEGEYRKNIADASSLPGLREAQSGALQAAGKLDTERAATDVARRFLDPEAWKMFYENLPADYQDRFQRAFPQPGAASPPPATSGTPLNRVQPPVTPLAPAPARPAAPSSIAPLSVAPDRRSSLTPSPLTQLSQTSLPSLLRPTNMLASNSLFNSGGSTRPTNMLASNSLFNSNDSTSLRKGTADVKAPKGAGLKKGSTNVKSQSSKSSKSSKSKGSNPPAGLEALLPMLMAASRGGGGAVGPQAADALPPPMAPGAAAPPGFARGVPSVHGYGYADGSADTGVDAGPNYPFGAGYLFGATTVPGEGSGKTDTVPAMLAPHEAVLNRAAADMLGRGLIAALNAHGVQKMQLGRGAAT